MIETKKPVGLPHSGESSGEPARQVKEASATEISSANVLDIQLLDDYFIQLLLPYITSLLDGFGPKLKGLTWTASPILQFLTILVSNGQTPAARILGFQCSPMGRSISGDFCNSRLLLFAIISTISSPISELVSKWLESQENFERTQTLRRYTDMEELSRQRRRRTCQVLQGSIKVGRLCCLLACWSRLSSSPSLAMLLSGLQYESNSLESNPRLHVDYAHRRWLQQEAMTAAKFLFSGLWMTDAWKPLLERWITKPVTRLIANIAPFKPMPGICPICHSEPIHVPFEASCGHVCCYTCLYEESMQTNAVQCRVCSRLITSSRHLQK